ncbi:MAG TPA: response regulator, partial [Bacillota bacterium]|nr:response regulator [Bacillota bacterium]
MKLKALIVDDEYPARKELRFLLQEFDNVEVVGEATNAQEALTLIKALDYSILFLDIQMPGMTGLELGLCIKELPNPPKIIFTSAYDEYAVEAFDVDAVDYLLKPIDEKRLARAIAKIEKKVSVQPSPEGGESEPPRNGEPARNGDPFQIKIDRIPAEKQGKT